MEVRFRTKKLLKQYLESREAEKKYGLKIARKYILRVNLIKRARDIDEIKSLPGLRCHQLRGNRQGQWAINLTGFYRLIFTLEGKKLQIVCIEEVSKHYDE